MSKSVETQLRALEAQLKALRARMAQDRPPTQPSKTLGDLYGILKDKAHSTEQAIREAQLFWEWESQPNET
jgi:hypothetical protein